MRQTPVAVSTAGETDLGSPPAQADPSAQPAPPLSPAASAALETNGRCRHCGAPSPGLAFCCAGCEAAWDLVSGLGLDAYYRRRTIDPDQRLLRPESEESAVDWASWVRDAGDDTAEASLLVEGLHCAACVWLIESVLARQPGVVTARVNMTSRRLRLAWRPAETAPERLVSVVSRLGYRLVPYDAGCLERGGNREEAELLRAMAVAGFAAGNVMLFSVSIWAGHAEGMGPGTRTFFHWISALIALPAIAWAGRPFFRAAWAALAARHVTMDVPIAVGVLLTTAMSLQQTIVGGEHAYFDAAIGLLFFLLIGRYLDRRARGQARSAAEHLLALSATAVTVLADDGGRCVLPPTRVSPGMRVLAAAGERIAVDGRITAGVSSIDTSLIDGESTPKPAFPGTLVFAGTINQSAPLTIEVTAAGEATLLAEIGRQVELAGQHRGRYVVLADRVARLYAPVVHSAALLTFILWWAVIGVDWQPAMMNAVAVLIITCPCALGLAVPVVQVVASGRLLRRGILIKSPTALERLAQVDAIVFDKTGTLTEGRPRLLGVGTFDRGVLAAAAALASASRHPLARALVQACEEAGIGVRTASGVRELPGQGLELDTGHGMVRLGSAQFCGVADGPDDGRAEMWFSRAGAPAIRFAFEDVLRADAQAVADDLRRRGLPIVLLSGDRRRPVLNCARALDIERWDAELRPSEKLQRLRAMAEAGQRVLMVGDGLNDAPALAAAHASMSPSTAIDISQTAADVVFQGAKLAPVREALGVARRARGLVRQNLALSLGYNLLAVPLAVGGQVTPLVAAIVMSTSSILVIANALRLNRMRA